MEASELYAQTDRALVVAKGYAVTEEAHAEKAADMVKAMAGLGHKLDERRAALLEPIQPELDRIGAVKKRLTTERDALKNTLTVYRQRVAAIEAKAREVARLAELERAEKMSPDTQEHVLTELATREAADTGGARKMRGLMSTTSDRKSWAFEVVDLTKVPTEYLELNERKVRAAIFEGERQIPGLRVYERVVAVVR